MGERSVSSVEKSANVRRCGGRVRGLVEEDAQMWGKRVGRVWGICMAEANQFARCCYLCGGDLSR